MAGEKRLIWDEDAKRHLIALAVGYHTETLHIDMILNAILHHTPTVDAVEVVHGRWVSSGCGFDCCSVCRKVYTDGYFTAMGIKPRAQFNYCPNCGANMMDGGDEDV